MRVETRHSADRRADLVLFQLIYLATLPAFLARAAVARLALPGRSGEPSGAARGLTVLDEAKVAARTCGAFALMG